MEFFYTVQASDMDADGISISANSLTLNGGVIRGADRAQDAVLTHAAADDDPDHKVDGGASFAPQVASVGFSLDPRSGETYVRGETIYMLVQFDRMAEVSGSPRVALTIGANTRYATYDSVSTPRPFRLRFVYTVQASDMDADGISIPANAVDLNGGAITLPGEPEVAAVLTHIAVDNDATRKVDGSMAEAPTVTAVAFFGNPLIGTTYTAGETIGAYVLFDREVDATGEPQLALTIGANTRQVSFIRVWESNLRFILFSYIVQTSDVDADGINFPADALSLNGGTITLRGNATTDAVLTHIATAADAGRKVDGSSSMTGGAKRQLFQCPVRRRYLCFARRDYGRHTVHQGVGRERHSQTGTDHRGQYPAGRVSVHPRLLQVHSEILVQRAGLGHGWRRNRNRKRLAEP